MISEGTLVNLFQRARARETKQTAAVLERVRASRVVWSDATSARVARRTGLEWVFVGESAVLHELAHQVRDVLYAIDAGDTMFAPAMLAFLQRAVHLGRKREQLQDSTMQRHRRELLKRLAAVLELDPTQVRTGSGCASVIRRCGSSCWCS